MDIQKNIFDEFFKKLEETRTPKEIIAELKTLYEKGEFTSQRKILEGIEKGIINANKN